jgi:hypothetical protein
MQSAEFVRNAGGVEMPVVAPKPLIFGVGNAGG